MLQGIGLAAAHGEFHIGGGEVVTPMMRQIFMRWLSVVGRSVQRNLHGKGVPLKTIAAITGRKSLDQLSQYIDVTPEQRRSAIMAR